MTDLPPIPDTGILQPLNRKPVFIGDNIQTRNERELPVSERPMHYGSGMRATICEIYYPAKETTDLMRVTCLDCKKLLRKRGLTVK